MEESDGCSERFTAKLGQVAVFPLPLLVLPNGRTRLRIFEPRYLNMVANCSKGSGHKGFVISRYDKNLPCGVSKFGSYVEIIDFDVDEQDILLIDVKVLDWVKLENFSYQDDKLLKADMSLHKLPLEHSEDVRSEIINDSQFEPLSRFLEGVYSTKPTLRSLYPQPKFDNVSWVCARLLETYPMALEKKERLVLQASMDELVAFLNLLIFGDENKSDPFINS